MSETEPPLALSIVVPVYNEEGNVEPLYGELTRVARALGRPYELVFVERRQPGRDARPPERAARPGRAPEDRRSGRQLRRAAALSAGFAHARGALVVTLDGDGQNDPADVPACSRGSDPSWTW